jgi:nicotinate-nucleotide pyrophosphorylase (carboxylating)
MSLPMFYSDEIILIALKEDINYIDVTTEYLISETQESNAIFLAKQDGVLCGLPVALRVFELLDNSFKTYIFKNDGDFLKKGDIIANVHGKTKFLLMGERTSLNLLQHMSGIATSVHNLASIIKHTKATVADTRKTLPGLRALQKYAVTVGGGKNHRFNLTDAAMIKDNHIDAVGSITKAVNTLRQKAGHTIKIEVETRNLKEVKEALQEKADIIMLDNMSCEQMKYAVELVNGMALLEASGNVTEHTIKNIAETGVDIISVGAITHSVIAMDISMKIK